MSQCITCQWILMRGEPMGKGRCWKDASETEKLLDVMEVRRCRVYKLGAISQVHARTRRRIVFDAGGVARLGGRRNE